MWSWKKIGFYDLDGTWSLFTFSSQFSLFGARDVWRTAQDSWYWRERREAKLKVEFQLFRAHPVSSFQSDGQERGRPKEAKKRPKDLTRGTKHRKYRCFGHLRSKQLNYLRGFWSLGEKSQDLFWTAPSKNTGIYAAFSMLLKVFFPCKRHKTL